jgi:hypothetical protein
MAVNGCFRHRGRTAPDSERTRPLVHVGCSTWFRLAKRKKSRLVVHEVRRARGVDGIGPKVNSNRQGTER